MKIITKNKDVVSLQREDFIESIDEAINSLDGIDVDLQGVSTNLEEIKKFLNFYQSIENFVTNKYDKAIEVTGDKDVNIKLNKREGRYLLNKIERERLKYNEIGYAIDNCEMVLSKTFCESHNIPFVFTNEFTKALAKFIEKDNYAYAMRADKVFVSMENTNELKEDILEPIIALKDETCIKYLDVRLENKEEEKELKSMEFEL